MKKIAITAAAICLLMGCKDIPYQESEPALILDESVTNKIVPVEVTDNAETKNPLPMTDSEIDIPTPPVKEEKKQNRERLPSTTIGDDRNVEAPNKDKKNGNKINLPKIEITSPVDNSYLSERNIEIAGVIDHPEFIQNLNVRYRGTSESNKTNFGAHDIEEINKNFSVVIGSELLDGDYIINISFKDLNGDEHNLPELKVSIDQTAPQIIGAIDGVTQLPYLQETIHYEQQFIDEKQNPRYEIQPIGKSASLDFNNKPTIYRWLTHINDYKTAPVYTFKLADDADAVSVKYALSNECASFEKATKGAMKNVDSTYEIVITQKNADIDLAHDSKDNPHCLSIWAIDHVGNKSNHQIEFFWKAVVPPISMDVNSVRYQAHSRRDDISWVGPSVWRLFRNGNPIVLKKNPVIGHVILSNPFSSPISSKLVLKKGLELKINHRKYQVPEKSIDIKYFVYDLLRNEVGEEKPLNDDSMIINSNETVIAKFILTKELPINGIRNTDKRFWEYFSMEIGFLKIGNNRPMVDGLSLITRDVGTGSLSAEYAVPWGSDHHVRRRSAPRVITPIN